nr:putative mitochondrial protein [Tanacetum cinerariifolium]
PCQRCLENSLQVMLISEDEDEEEEVGDEEQEHPHLDYVEVSVQSVGTEPINVLPYRYPRGMLTYNHGTTLTFEVDQYLQERDQMLEELKRQFLRSQQLMKEQADEKRRDVSFGVVQRANQKLALRFYGLYELNRVA